MQAKPPPRQGVLLHWGKECAVALVPETRLGNWLTLILWATPIFPPFFPPSPNPPPVPSWLEDQAHQYCNWKNLGETEACVQIGGEAYA